MAHKSLSLREIVAALGLALPDCGDNSCSFGGGPGMRTNGGCHCMDPKSSNVLFRRGTSALARAVVLLHQRLVKMEEKENV